MSTKRKAPFAGTLGQPKVKTSAKLSTKHTLNDKSAVVTGGGQADSLPVNGDVETIEISSDSGSESDDEASGDEENVNPEEADISMQDGQNEEEDVDAEPTFGDLVRTTLEPIDVSSAFPPAQNNAPNNLLAAPSSASLSTVLTQALRTSDTVLLESCLQTTDLATIRTTIQRLSSPLASNLLSVLASRLHRRPGRAGSLMVWIQWTLVAHGGYLATQKELVKQLASLSRVVDERARGLNSLLMLKGKLDMLEAQGALRKAMMGRSRDRGDDSDEDDDAVVYVEADEDIEALSNGATTSSRRFLEDQSDDDDDSDDEAMPNTSAGADDSEDDDESDDDSQGLIDDEAEESGDNDSDAEEIDFDDEDEIESGDESDDAAPARGAPPTKMQKVGGLFSRHK